MSTTEKSVTTTSKAARSSPKRKRIFDEKEVEVEHEGSGNKATGHFIDDDEDLEAADVDGSAEGSGFDAADLGKSYFRLAYFLSNAILILHSRYSCSCQISIPKMVFAHVLCY